MKGSRNAGALSNFSLFARIFFELPWLGYLSQLPKIWAPYNRVLREKGRATVTEKPAQPQICKCVPIATIVLKAIAPLILYKSSVLRQPTEIPWFGSEANTCANSATTLCRIQQMTAWGTQVCSRKHSAVWQISEPLRTGIHHEKWARRDLKKKRKRGKWEARTKMSRERQ